MICRPFFIKPLVATVKRLIGVLSPQMMCGVWYRRILKRLQIILCIYDCEGLMVGDEVQVTETLTTIRVVEQRAKKTYVTNLGSNRLRLYEGGALVQVLWPGKTWESPINGRLSIEGEAIGGNTLVSVTTHRRCICDIPADYYAVVDTPIGGHLI